jgi:hypothetical protein
MVAQEVAMKASFYRPFFGITVLICLCCSVWAEEERDLIARFRDIEPSVTVQRADESGAESAAINFPFLPGDRTWTDAGGRAELQFADGSLVWLDQGSKLDFAALPSRDQAVLQLWSGALLVRVFSPEVSFTIETSSASVTTSGLAEVRVDIRDAQTRVTTHAGEVAIENGEDRRTLRAGERAYVRFGEHDWDVESFDPYASDAFDRWVMERDSEIRWSDAHARRLPEEIAPYVDELDAHGTWRYDADVGEVWYPHVDPGWSPYADGRWIWTTYGWTWVPRERWGWATCHFGRWGFSLSLGWYWIPARTWGPAWVSWTFANDYIGWCPLGRHNRAVFIYHHDRRRQGRFDGHRAWLFARRVDFGGRAHSRRHGNDFRPGRTRFTAYSGVERRPNRGLSRWENPKAHGERARFSKTRMTGAETRHPRRAASRPEWSSRYEDRGSRVKRSTTTRTLGRVFDSTRSRDSRRQLGRSFDSQRNDENRPARSSRRRISAPQDDRRSSSRAYTRSARERQPLLSVFTQRRSEERQRSSNASARSAFRGNQDSRKRDSVSRFLRSVTRSNDARRNETDRSERSRRIKRSSSQGESRRAVSAERRTQSRGHSKGARGRSARKRR